MPNDERPSEEPTQTTPQGETIPIPTRKDVFRDLEKVARPSRSDGERSPEQ